MEQVVRARGIIWGNEPPCAAGSGPQGPPGAQRGGRLPVHFPGARVGVGLARRRGPAGRWPAVLPVGAAGVIARGRDSSRAGPRTARAAHAASVAGLCRAGAFGGRGDCVQCPWPRGAPRAGLPRALWMPTVNCFIRPVLKHGPRSLTHVRVLGWKTRMHNESEGAFRALRREAARPHRRPTRTPWEKV